MHDIRRLTVIVVAWVAPAAWIAAALLSGPSDGTLISRPTALVGAPDWEDDVTVERVYGDTPLAEGDVVVEVDGQRIADLVDNPRELSAGDTHTYTILRPDVGLPPRS